MQNPDVSNELFQLASELVNYTSQHIFLTGKAGTGKTTFLKYIRETAYKNIAVVAPTGVAAINAGGVTMHSFFNLPFEPFLPVKQFGAGQYSAVSKTNIFSKVQLSNVKREVMEELELLVIDEVSMLRSDKLDAIDTILRGVRRNNTPFGGVQVLFIGDMYQLPPVTTEEEWNILKPHYASPFFFDAKVMEEIELNYIELKIIYRQKEAQFINLLNNIRNNSATEEDLMLLHRRYDPDFSEVYDQHAITITTHNYKADSINNRELKKLKGPEIVFKGIIEGEFSDKSLPTELNLVIKPGAQIMFIKNDSGEEREYYNGKLAVVKDIIGEEITVTMQEEGTEFKLKRETWENVRYSVSKETGRIEEEVLGTFRQFPVRLAWAITIHKSQGLTFENIIIDAGQSFAAGQVYVALSRCTTLEGMTLLSKINPQSIATDQRIVDFSKKENDRATLEEVLAKEKRIFLSSRILKAFQFQKVTATLENYAEFIQEKNIPEKDAVVNMVNNAIHAAKENQVVAEKFTDQLRKILGEEVTDIAVLKERVSKAIVWFAENSSGKILIPLRTHIDSLKNASRVRQYLKYAREVYAFCENHLKNMLELQYDSVRFMHDHALIEKYLPAAIVIHKGRKPKEPKAPKGESQRLSLQLFKEGKTIEQIAKERNLVPGTIESHLGSFIKTGEVDILEMMTASKYNAILDVAGTMENPDISTLRIKLGDTYSYGQIKAALMARQKELEENAL